jgi:hypothetical protein
MKTLPEKLEENINSFFFKITSSKIAIRIRDSICIIFGHKKRYLPDIDGNFRGDFVCRRCNRRRGKGDWSEFYHNWEIDNGENARCHNHKRE